MLDRVLELLREGGTHRIDGLARELDATPELVEAMLEDLSRMGYLKRVSARCPGTCAECPSANMCAVGGSSSGANSGEIWVLVQK